MEERLSSSRALLLLVWTLAGCAGGPWSFPAPSAAPASGADPAVTPPAAEPEATPAAIAPGEPAAQAVPLVDLEAARQARDSAADVAVLDQLAQARPPDGDTPDGTDPFAALEARDGLGGLDLTTYAEHERVRYYLDFFLGPARSRMAVWLQRLPVYEPMVRERFEAEGLPSDLVYLGLIESGYSNVAVSRSRAVGMWQFMRGTARWIGLRVDGWVDERRDPVKATEAAARYLKYLSEKFGSVYLAAAAYNGGPGTVSRGLSRGGIGASGGDVVAGDGPEDEGWTDADFFTLADTRYLRRETKDYVPKLIAAALIARNPAAFGFDPVPVAPRFPLDSIVVPDMTGLDVLAELADTPLETIRTLNPHFLRVATPPGRSVVRLPAGTMAAVAARYAALPPAKRVRIREHFVSRGETLGGIARRYGISLGLLRETNPAVRRTSLIRVGQRLIIPPGASSGGGGSAASSAPSTSAASSRPATHTVRRGETLSGIAGRYGLGLSQLQRWNRISDPGTIRVGQWLRLSGAEGGASAPEAGRAARTHLVRRGETLEGLARRYGTSVQALMQANALRSARALQAGRRITIP
jgi:membrane-bound lytic murein transglycosylase D